MTSQNPSRSNKKKRSKKRKHLPKSPPKSTAKTTKVSSVSELSPTKKRIFTLILFLIPVIFFLLLEFILTLMNYGGNLDLFVTAPEKEIAHYKRCNPDIGQRYFFMQFTKPSPSKDLFLKEKPENGYRIFVMGGSTTAGFPYGNNMLFSRILSKRLTDIFPEKRIECINTAMAAINSYTLMDFVDEIIDEKPDAVLIYAGHNEFYGALGVASVESLGKFRGMVRAYLSLKRFRTFILIRDIIASLRKMLGSRNYDEDKVNPTATLMERIVAEQTIPLNSDLYQMGIYQYRENLEDIIASFKNAGIAVITSELVSNIRDQKPFIAAAADSLPSADDVYRQARFLEQSQKYQEALAAYEWAKDLDQLRFRATEELNKITHTVSANYNVPVVPMKKYFQNQTPHGLIGDQLMIDHLHPNIEGYFIMADAFLTTMRKNQLIATNWPEARIRSSSEYLKNWGLTNLDSVYADLSIQFLKGGWPFKPRHHINRVLDNFRAKTKAESLIVASFFQQETGIEVLHLDLAKYYERRQEWEPAYREYQALIHTIPFETMFYEGAARMLFKQERYDEAIPILKKSLQIKETGFALKWIGQILLLQDEFTEAIPYLEQARKIEKKDSQLLYNLGRAYILTRQRQKAREIINLFKKRFPRSKYISMLVLELSNPTAGVSSEFSAKMNRAKEHMENQNLNAAAALLQEIIQNRKSQTAYKWLGQIYLAKKEYSAAISALNQARQLKASDPYVLYNLSLAYFMNKQYKKADNVYQQLQQQNPRFPDPSNLKQLIPTMNEP